MTEVKVPLKVQKRSGFDWSHHNGVTHKVGELCPLFVNEVIPNTKIYMRYALGGSLPPLSSDTYMKCYYDVRAFFVPMRILYGGFESWFTDYAFNVIGRVATTNVVKQVKSHLPYFSIDPGAVSIDTMIGRETLADYLGYKFDYATFGASLDSNIEFSVMPFLAYHAIYDSWYRQKNISVPIFARPSADAGNFFTGNSFAFERAVAMAPYISPAPGYEVCTASSTDSKNSAQFLFADGVSIFDLRQCNYDYDYFTNALPSAQLGNPQAVTTGGGQFTIASLRVSNSLQQFAELNQMCGADEVSTVMGRYGANLSNSLTSKPIYLGGSRIDIANKSVDVTVNSSAGYSVNPMINQVGASGGKAWVQGTDVIIDNFVAKEPGYIFVMGSLIPKVTYSSGVRRYLRHYIGTGSLVDMPNPQLQNVGNQPIYQWELNGSLGDSSQQVLIFGWTDRYAEAMTMEDECHGLFGYGGSLESFIAQRFFPENTNPVIGSNFLEVPTSALDNVTAVTGDISRFGFYGQIAFDCKVSQPLAQYSMPSLQNPAYEHGKTIKLHRGGFRF